MNLEASNSQRLISKCKNRKLVPDAIKNKPKWLKKRFNFWIGQGKSVEEAEKLCITPIKELKAQEVKAIFAVKNKIDKPYVSKPAFSHIRSKQEPPSNKPAFSHIRSTQEPPSKPLKGKPHSTLGSIRVGLRAERPIGPNDAPLVMREVGRLIDISTEDVSPRFVRSILKAGIIVITCVDRETRDWLERQVTLLKPWEGAQLRLVEEADIPKARIGVTWMDDDLESKTILSRLHRQNRELGCLYWKILNIKKEEKGQTVTFSFDETSFNTLRRNNFQAFLTTDVIHIRVKNYRPEVKEATVSNNSNETRNAYEPLVTSSEHNQPFLQPRYCRSSTLVDEDILKDSPYGGPSGVSADYENEEDPDLTDWSLASSEMSSKNEDSWQHGLPDDPCEARRSKFMNDQAEREPSLHAELNMPAIRWCSETETRNSRQYDSVSAPDSYGSDLLSSHGERYTKLSTAEHQRLSPTFNMEPEHSTSRHNQNAWQYSSGNSHDSRCKSREKYEDSTRSSASFSRQIKQDFSAHDIIWKPRSEFASSSTHRTSSPSRYRQYDCEGSRARNSQGQGNKRPQHTAGSGYSRGNSSKRGRSSYTPYQRR